MLKQVEKGNVIVRLRKQDVENLQIGNTVTFDRDWLPFGIELRYIDVDHD